MALANADIRGLREAAAAFRKLPDIAKEAFLDASMQTAARMALIAAATLQPGYGYRTGQLKRAIGWDVSKRTGQASVGIRRGFDLVLPGRNGKVHSPTKIGHLVEFGHSGGADAKPFMTPAAEKVAGFFLDQCRQAGKTIERDMANVGGRFL